ncbi:trimethylguanosine synthase [Rhizodiscina lignyota]|uniref:Trimethylguanosine synthase n=1 Tax=Rhizodiscina lignyota TaxID=1504668 RepID=A0A9P4MA51_9PEZI|nr:trimethylguanosine synthase [Rhizodiscina lignyota]
MPENVRKYWYHRYDLFSKYDEGVELTSNSWFGVTPEAVAVKIAQHIGDSVPPSKKFIIDAFAGAGGNAIAFALSGRWERVFAVEKDPEELKCAKQNAKVYGVEKKISFVNGDCFNIIKNRYSHMREEAVIFASPPWGGPTYQAEDIFDLSKMEPYTLKKLHTSFSKYFSEMVFYLPRTSDLNQLAALVKDGDQIQAIHYCMTGFSKALCAYYGDFADIQKP